MIINNIVCIPFSVSIILYVRIINNLQAILKKKQVQAVMVLVSDISVVCKLIYISKFQSSLSFVEHMHR